MGKTKKYHLEIQIDKLTNSIENTISGDSFPTDVTIVKKTDLKTVDEIHGWNFDWHTELKLKDRNVYKLTIRNNPNIIQGLASISDYTDHFHLHLVESAPFNLGRKKLYQGVPGNLVAYACKLSWDNGNQGIIAFQAKTRLITHYESTLGAVHIGGQKMIIFPKQALSLINKYYPDL